jgi:imidazole glycerol-phosphate synthase subunit HisF
MLPRVMPCLLLRGRGLVKTVRFQNPRYVGDPINAIAIYNEKEVDELIFLDITATPESKPPPFDVIGEIASECFMPVAYGGGVRSLEDVKRIFGLGIEKVAINSFAVERPEFIREAADRFGSQSIVVAIDVKKTLLGGYKVFTHGGRKATSLDPIKHAVRMQELGAGEILLNSIDRDGTLQGYDVDLIRRVTSAVNVPVIACGGAGKVEDFGAAVKEGGASAAAAGSLVVFHGRNQAVLINFPTRQELRRVLS